MAQNALPLTIEELEEGVRLLDYGQVDFRAFWHLNDAAFGQTLLVAMRDTAEALSSERLSPLLRGELENQMELLRQCFDDNYGIAGRA